MKHLSIFIFGLLLAAVASAQQGRYLYRTFNAIDTHNNIQYGSADRYDAQGVNNPEPLYFDVYEPSNDTAQMRPVVLAFFGGSFIGGSKEATDIKAWCDSLAHHGYVAVAVGYRIGFNIFQQGAVTRAGYRALQDSRAAVRFLKEFHTTYRIDTNQIFMVGNSAGSITALQTAYADETDRPAESYGIAGTVGDSADLGCLDCTGNSYAHSVDIKAVVGLWGAVLNLDAIDVADGAQALMFHGDDDTVVPVDSGNAFQNTSFPVLYGSRSIAAKLNSLNMGAELYVYAGEPHNFYYDGAVFPNAYWETIWTISNEYLCRKNSYCNSSMLGAIPAEAPAFSMQLFPNPAHTELTLVSELFESGDAMLRIFNANGQEIACPKSVQAQTAQVSVQHLPAGFYFAHVQTAKGRAVQKFIVVR